VIRKPCGKTITVGKIWRNNDRCHQRGRGGGRRDKRGGLSRSTKVMPRPGLTGKGSERRSRQKLLQQGSMSGPRRGRPVGGYYHRSTGSSNLKGVGPQRETLGYKGGPFRPWRVDRQCNFAKWRRGVLGRGKKKRPP